MPLTETAKSLIEQPLPRDKVRQRPGKGGKTFDYVSSDFVIRLLNEAFDYKWDTRIVSHDVHDNTVVVGLELRVYDVEGVPIVKQQFGSCDAGHGGMGLGEAFKGAASDALKKAATLLGVALELYQDEAPADTGFRKPAVPSRPPAAPPAPTPPASAPRPRPPVTLPVSAPQPPAQRNPFDRERPPASVPAPPAAPITPPKPVAAPVPKSNPFERSDAAPTDLSTTQHNALNNLAKKKGLSQSDMIALAGIADSAGNPKQAFEELTHAEAIQVIKASQL